MKKLLNFLFILFLTNCNLFSASETTIHLNIRKIATNPSNYNNEKTKVLGYLLIDELGHLYLHPDTKESSKYLDVVFSDDTKDNVTLKMNLKCVIVSGIFRNYTDKYIELGWATSKIGIIKATNITLCSK